jgi:hypothetical protein
VAGGFDSPDAVTHLLASKRADERRWEATFYNNSGASQTYTAIAYCDASPPALKTRTKARVVGGSTPAQRFGQSVTASCRRSQSLRSGGFEIERDLSGPAEEHDLGLVHASRRRKARGWRVTAFAYLGRPELTAYAYCR